MNFKRRTHTCGELNAGNVDTKVVLNGWVDRRRDLGGVIFIGLRDRYGVTQFEPEHNQEAHQLAKQLRSEFVIAIEGKVRKRPDDQINKEMATGEIDIIADKLVILSEAETPPFPIKDKRQMPLKICVLSTGISICADPFFKKHFCFVTGCTSW